MLVLIFDNRRPVDLPAISGQFEEWQHAKLFINCFMPPSGAWTVIFPIEKQPTEQNLCSEVLRQLFEFMPSEAASALASAKLPTDLDPGAHRLMPVPPETYAAWLG